MELVWKINKPVAGDAIASRCAFVIRGANNPCEVLVMSNNAEAVGVVVPSPALPVNGYVLVWALTIVAPAIKAAANKSNCFFILICFKNFKNGMNKKGLFD